MSEKSLNLSRRKFLYGAASGLAAAGLAAMPTGAAFGQDKKDDQPGEIIYRRLGRTKIKVPIVSMGVMNADVPSIIQASYEMGTRHFDTAAYYQIGRNEQMLGSVIRKMGIRDKVVIGTKIYVEPQRVSDPVLAKKKIISECDASLKRLKTDYVDILYIHSVEDPDTVNDPAIREALTVLKKQGKIRFTGISTHTAMADVINEMAKDDFYDVVLTAINFTMANDDELLASFKNAYEKGIGIIAMKVMAGGGHWPNPESRRNYSSGTIASACLKWVMRNEHIATCIPGYDNYEHMEQDFAIARKLDYTEDEKKLLGDNEIILSLGFCRQCKSCLASCPHDTDIPTLMRTHMYATQYGNLRHAKAVLGDIPEGRNLNVCSACDKCSATCANSVDIPGRIDDLKMIYA